MLEDCRAVALPTAAGRCVGVRLHDGRVVTARAVVLATGGAAALWSRTTNPTGAVGAGMVLAHAAGAALADLEMMQFHPTAVAGANGVDGFLVTEAVRGEGALLLDAAGERFVDELAPRDEVALAVARRMRDTGAASVGLDMRDRRPGAVPERRRGPAPQRDRSDARAGAGRARPPTTRWAGSRPTSKAAPRVPGPLRRRRVRLHRPARREPARVQLAQRVLRVRPPRGARRARRAARRPRRPRPAAALPRPELTPASREALWQHAGIERDAEGLRTLLDDRHPLVRLVAACALAREESRGAHLRRDFPERDAALDEHHTVVRDANPPGARALGLIARPDGRRTRAFVIPLTSERKRFNLTRG